MPRISELLSLVPLASISETDLGVVGLTCDDAIQELLQLFAAQSTTVKTGFVHVLLRALETYILSDNELLNLARFHDVFLGTEDAHISRRIEQLLGVPPPPDLVKYVRRCLTSYAATAPTGGKAGMSPFMDRLVLESVVQQHPRQELRCAICGYHFLEVDVRSRLDLLQELGGVLAKTIEPKRLEDGLKPAVAAKGVSLTQLELDHIVPEEGFGWTDSDNLQVTCKYCNGGRLIFRRALEPVSTMVAGSLGSHPPTRPHRLTRQVIVVSKLLESNGICSFCGASRQDRELTVQLRDASVPSRLWFVPWNLEATCYKCRRN